MTGTELLRILKEKGCKVLRQKGSHVRVRCGKCFTTVPVHKGEDLDRGTLAIERQLAPCLGEDWLKPWLR